MAGNVFERKSEARQELSRRRRALTFEEVTAKGGEVLRHLAALPVFERALIVGLYAAQAVEVPTEPLARWLWARGQRVALPLPTAEQSLTFHEVKDWSELKPGAFGILSPPTGAPLVVPELLIVPGLGFTPSGVRLGRGGGYYDRVLVSGVKAIGVTFDCCVVDALPVDPWDQRVSLVVTESGVRGITPRSGD